MKTNTVQRASQLIITFLLSFFCLSLSAQKLPDFGVKLQKGDLYCLDYQVSRVFSFPRSINHQSFPILDTVSVVKKIIRMEVVEEFPEHQYLLAISSERNVSKFGRSGRVNTHDDVYQEASTGKFRLRKTDQFTFGAVIPSSVKNRGQLHIPQFTHLKVDANLSVIKVYQNEEDAKLDKGRAPHTPAHLWLDFDKIGVSFQPDQMHLLPYIAPVWEKEVPSPQPLMDHLNHFSASYIEAFTVDSDSGWLHFAQFTDKRKVAPQTTVLKTIKGWKGEAKKRTIVHGYVTNAKGVIRKENLTELVPFYFDKARQNISLDSNGYFRWEAYLDQPAYFSLKDLKGDDLLKIYGYVQPGDELYVEANFNNLKSLVFKGRNRAANQFLNQNEGLPLPGLTEWLGQITIPYDKWAQEEVNELVTNARKKSLARLKQHKAILDPKFYQDEYWRLTYSLARFIKPTSGEEINVSKSKFLPIINMQAEHLPVFWAYIEEFAKQQLQKHQFNKLSRSYLTFRERYNSSKLFLSGFPQHIVMYHALREALYHKKAQQEQIAFMKNEFLDLCRDENLTTNIRFLSKQLKHTAPGNYFLNLQLLDTLGNRLEMKDFIGKKIVIEPVFRISSMFGANLYKQWQEKYPDILFIRLALFDRPDNFTAYRAQVQINPTLNLPYYFPANNEEKARVYQYLAIDSLHLYSRYPHLFFLDEKGKIIKQEYYSFKDNLAAFAELPSAIIPIWKNPIWKVAIPLSLLFGLLTWLSLRIIGRIREKNLERQRQMVEMELNSIRSQLNPHFVYNTMSSIQNLILSDRSEQASQYLAELAGLMRAVLNQTKKGIISLEEELTTIRQYCKLEALRKSFAWNIKVDKSVDLHNTDIPALLLQPYIENAIIHGLRGNEVDGKIDLTISKKNGSLDILIQDNGVGIVENQHRSLGGNHLGLHLNRKRLELLYGKLAKVIIQDLNHQKKGKTGTQVAINIPI